MDRAIALGRAVLTGLVALAATGSVACSSAAQVEAVDRTVGAGQLEQFEYRRLAMGCEARLLLWSASEGQARAAARAAFARLTELDRSLSDYKPTGPVAEVAAGAGAAVATDETLIACLIASTSVAAASQGAFDPTAAPVTHLWREARHTDTLPTAADVDAAAALVDWTRLAIDPEAGTVALASPGMSLDLGGVAKGFAAEELLEVLTELGHPRALVDLGGDLALGDAPPERAGWRVLAGVGEGARVLELTQACVATSGATEQFIEADGRHLSHIVDPRSGWPVTHGRIVTAVVQRAAGRPAGAWSDALASAASVLSVPAAERLVAGFEGAMLAVQHEGTRPLFDGESLAGWTTTGGRYDGEAQWTVEDGELVGRTGAGGEGGLIYTDELFTACELELDVKLEYPYDSGIFLRMLPPDTGLKGAQVTLDHRPGGEIAGIYADGWLEHNPEAEAHFKKDEWNHVRVRTTGFDFRIEVWLNGTKVTDYRLPEGTPGYAPHGRIGLQVHPADADAASRSVRFRDIRVRSLPIFGEELFEENPKAAAGVLRPKAPAASDGESSDAGAWRDLLAKGLDGLMTRGDGEGYTVERGVLSIPSDGGGEIGTVDDFRDFRLTAEFNIARMANSGLYLRASREPGNSSYSGAEVQILDDYNWETETNSTLVDYQFTGGLYGAVAPPPLELKGYRPHGEWNRYEVLYRGSRLAVALNGLALYDVDTLALEVEPPFAQRAESGFIGFQRYPADTVEDQAAIRVRNFFVQPLR
ncbi:family 16 glycoside hydrolase [Engelhardtia mirabilis]